MIESYPEAPSENGGAGAGSWAAPEPSTARAKIRWEPLPGEVHGNVHNRHVSPPRSGGSSEAGSQGPSSVFTSTPEIPRSPARATPPISTEDPTTELYAGVAMIAVVRIAPLSPPGMRSEFVQPFCCQNPANGPCTRVMWVTHFAWNIP